MTTDPITSRLLVREHGRHWSAPTRTGFLSESDLQHLIAEQPTLIPDVSAQALGVREFATGVGPTDVVIVDADGSLTLVECKLASNDEVRRKIVGQVLDYASRLWRMSLEDFDARWVRRSGESLLEQLDDQARDRLHDSLAEGSLTLVLAVDRINEDLRRIVEYLNAHTGDTVRVLAIELDRAEHSGLELLIPTTYGAEIADAKSRERSGQGSSRWSQPQWQIADLLQAVRQDDITLGDTVESFWHELTAAGLHVVGTRSKTPSLVVVGALDDGSVWPYSIYTRPGGRHMLGVNYAWLRPVSQQKREEFLSATADVLDGVNADAVRDADLHKRPNVGLDVLADPHVRATLVGAAGALLA